jgi:hypothetical protein
MEAKPEDFLDAPIPGMSLTAEPKSRPWRRPSQVSTVDEALALYAPIFSDKKAQRMMLEQIENKIPLTSIADILITGNAMEGRHTLDVGILVAPVLIETMITFAEMAGIEYVVGNEERDTPETTEEIVNRAVRAVSTVKDEDEMEMSLEEQEQPMEELEPSRTGLMARKEEM